MVLLFLGTGVSEEVNVEWGKKHVWEMRLVFVKPEGNPRADTLLSRQSVSFRGAALALVQLLTPSMFGFTAVSLSGQSLTGLDSHVSSVTLLSAQGMSLPVLGWGFQGF